MDADKVREINREGWNRLVEEGNPWTIPVEADVIRRARLGDWAVVLTPTKPVPADWFGDVRGKDVLCLASGGGQQGPVLAAAGARSLSSMRLQHNSARTGSSRTAKAFEWNWSKASCMIFPLSRTAGST